MALAGTTAYTAAPMPYTTRRPPRLLAVAVILACGLLTPRAALAQGTGSGDGVRFGVSFGGISTVGFTVEYFHDNRSLDLTVGTWSFRDLSASIVVKEYFGRSDALPFVGAGLWLVVARPAGERTGFAGVLHAPVGVDWRAAGDHFLGLQMNVNRALWVRRSDPEDELPLNRRLVPLPGVYYRWRH